MEVLRKPSSMSLGHKLGPEIEARRNAILLHKGDWWPTFAPSWCLMILDEFELEKSEELARRIWIQEYYQVFDYHRLRDQTANPIGKPIRESGDEEFLEAWAEDVRG